MEECICKGRGSRWGELKVSSRMRAQGELTLIELSIVELTLVELANVGLREASLLVRAHIGDPPTVALVCCPSISPLSSRGWDRHVYYRTQGPTWPMSWHFVRFWV